jgi:hypothetical protein
LRDFRDSHETRFNDMFDAFYEYAFDGGLASTGEIMYMSTSLHVFTNHACGTPNLQGLMEAMPFTKEFWQVWNPVADRRRSEINAITITARDIKAGEMITDDYSRWDGYFANKNKEHGHPLLKEWCGNDSSL